MAITLVPKYVRALAEQLNAYYRVLRGADPDSIDLRLNGGGHFIVHHSGTNAAVFAVTDAGATGSYQPGDIGTADLADGAVTSAKIADNEIVNADINGAAAIALTKIAHVGANNVLRSTGGVNVGGQVVSGDIADDTIVNADINSAAAIAVTKIAHVGAGNVLRSTGTQNVGGPLVAADIPNNSITSAKIVDNEIVNADINTGAAISITKIQDVGANNVLRSDGAGNVAGKIVTGDIADGTLMNVDVNASAGILIGKLADVGANNVLRSSGAGNVAGKVVSGDIQDDTIVNADIFSGAAIAPSKLAAVTAGQILKDVGSGVVGGGLVVDANVAAAGTANIALGKLAPGASGLVKSNGTAISAGNQLGSADLPTGGSAIITSAMIVDGTIATSDMTLNTISGDRLLDASIPSSKLITGAPISPGSVGTAEIAANATFQTGIAVATTSGPSTGSAAYVDVPEMAVTLSTVGGELLVWFTGVFYNSNATGATYCAISLDGAAEVAERYIAPSGANEQAPLVIAHRFAGVSGTVGAPVSHTVKVRWKTASPTSTTAGVFRSLIVMEAKR